MTLFQGPVLQDSDNTSLVAIKRMMMGEMPLVPNASLPVCDVRDVAAAHINAMVISRLNIAFITNINMNKTY